MTVNNHQLFFRPKPWAWSHSRLWEGAGDLGDVPTWPMLSTVYFQPRQGCFWGRVSGRLLKEGCALAEAGPCED